MRKHFDNDGARDKVCLTLWWIARSNIQTGGRKIFSAGETFHIDYDVGGTDPSHTCSLSSPALALREKEGVGNRAGARERERDGAREGAS